MKIMFKKIFFKLFLFLTFVLLLFGAGAFYWYQQGLKPVDPDSQESQDIVIAKGSSVKAISHQLSEAGLIKSPLHFQLIIRKQGIAHQIQAGTFTLSPSLSTPEIATKLTQGTNDIWVTIKEGWRATEIGEYLASTLPKFEASGAVYQTQCLDQEGYLFPETYLVPKEYDSRQMCQLLRSQFDAIITDLQTDIQQSGFSMSEIITLASLIQREARNLEDMKLVSGILYNRLELGMPLQVDATLQYIKGYDSASQTWWPTPLSADKDLNSPFNTYQNPGLPPAPIANPGQDAIIAAIHPTPSDYLYYISNSQGSQMHYATTYPEHQQNIDRYLR